MPNKTNQQFRPIVGIDLGTTNSAVAYIKNGKPKIIPSPKGERIIPSVVLIDLKNHIIVGEDAKDALVAMPDRSVSAIKRKMGSREPITVAEKSLLPQEISALILKELKSYVDTLYGKGEKEAVITVPAYFTDEQRRATKEAGELAGFIVERIINEPTAAALAFGLEHIDEDRHFLVYDLGGGTFDVSVVEMMDGLLEVKASAGNHMLGGEDFDWKIVDWLSEKIIAEHKVDPRKDMRANAFLKEAAENIKKQLSDEHTVSIDLPLVTVKDNKPVGILTEINRDEFLGLINLMLQETMESIHKVLKDANLSPEEIDEVLLVGGSTRIPSVQEMIYGVFGKAARTDVNPDEAVALGAAVQAGLKSGALSDSGLVATDVAPFSMGVSVVKAGLGGIPKPGGFAPVIDRNTTIPVTRTEKFSTTAPGQTVVAVEIYQGEHEWVKNNYRLGEFTLTGIPANLQEQEDIDVTFRYNLNGILEVSASCVSTGKEMSVVVQDGLQRDSQEAFLESSRRLEDLWNNSDTIDDDNEGFDEIWEGMDGLLNESVTEEISINPEPSVLHEEAIHIRERAVKMLNELDLENKEKAQQVIDSLNAAIAGNDMDQLQSVIDEAIDTLIDLEL